LPELKKPFPIYPNMIMAPACPNCSAPMKLTDVRPDDGVEDRTFECPTCHYFDIWVFKSI
jgi:hypothetical protein